MDSATLLRLITLGLDRSCFRIPACDKPLEKIVKLMFARLLADRVLRI